MEPTAPAKARFCKSAKGRLAVALVACSVLLVLPGPDAGAQSGAEAERSRIGVARATLGLEIDALVADSAEIDKAIDDLGSNVAEQEERARRAAAAAADAERRATAASEAAEQKAAEVALLRGQVAELAVNAYVNPPGQEMLEQMKVDSANDAARRQALLEAGVRHVGELLDLLREAKHDLELEREQAARTAEEAKRQVEEATHRAEELKAARAEQEGFASELEQRLNSKLAEADALASIDAALSAQIKAEQAALAQRLRDMAPPTPPTPPSPPSGGGSGGSGGGAGGDEPGVGGGGSSPSTTVPSSPPTTAPTTKPRPALPSVPVTTVRGITVNSQIAGALDSMLAAASADGVSFGGSGYRSSDQQIYLRRQNCGTSDYAIWNMPAWQCSPPTAIPGTSMHERGLAIDFTYQGRAITSRDSAGFKWLAANAGSYGFYNLPSEPWHWSTSGQ